MVMEEWNNDILSNIDKTVEADNSISQEELKKALKEGMFGNREDVTQMSEALKDDQNELAQSLKTSLNATVDEILDNPDWITEDSKKILELWCILIGESDQEKYEKAGEILGLSKKTPPTEKNNDLWSWGWWEHQVENVEKFSNDDIKTAESELKDILTKIRQRNTKFLWSSLQKNEDAIKYIQILLKVNGYEVNQYEGKFDYNTKDAIIKFQKDHKPLVADGKVWRFTLETLLNTKETRDAVSDKTVPIGNDDDVKDETREWNEVDNREFWSMEDIKKIWMDRIKWKDVKSWAESRNPYFECAGKKYPKIGVNESWVGYRIVDKKRLVLWDFTNWKLDGYGIGVGSFGTYKWNFENSLFSWKWVLKNNINQIYEANFRGGKPFEWIVKYPESNNSPYIAYKWGFKNWNPNWDGMVLEKVHQYIDAQRTNVDKLQWKHVNVDSWNWYLQGAVSIRDFTTEMRMGKRQNAFYQPWAVRG